MDLHKAILSGSLTREMEVVVLRSALAGSQVESNLLQFEVERI